MHISKQSALFIYAVLHQYKTSSELTDSDTSQVTTAMDEISTGLCGESTLLEDDEKEEEEDSGEDEAFDEDDEEEDEEDEEPKRKSPIGQDFRHLSAISLQDLKPISVLFEGVKNDLEFEDNDFESSVDVLVDGSCVVEEATHLLLEDGKLEAFDGEDWHAFPLATTRLPKAWKTLINEGVIYDII